MIKLGRRAFGDSDLLIMAIVNRTPDSFDDKGATFAHDVAIDGVRAVVRDGAEVVDTFVRPLADMTFASPGSTFAPRVSA